MKKGRLSRLEELAIQGMLHNKAEIEDIASELDRSVNVVTKYVDTLDDIHTTVAAAQTPKPKVDLEARRTKVYNDALLRLKAQQFSHEDAERLLERAIREKTGDFKTGVALVQAALLNMKAGDLIKHHTGNGKPGVAVMTEPASARGDEAMKTARDGRSRTSKGNIWRIKEQDII